MLSNKEIGKRIKKAREIKGEKLGYKYTGEMLANSIKISRGFLGDIETGRKPAPEHVLDSIIKVCELEKDFFKESNIIEIDKYKDVTDVEEAMKIILSQQGLMLNGELLSDEDKIKVANAILIGLRYAAEQIEREKKEK